MAELTHNVVELHTIRNVLSFNTCRCGMSEAGCFSSAPVSMCACVFADCPELTQHRLQSLNKTASLRTLTLTGEQASLISGQTRAAGLTEVGSG